MDSFYRDSAWLTLALLTVNASSYLLNIALSHMLPKGRFAEVVAMLSVVFLFNVPALAVQTLVAREVAQNPANRNVNEVFQGIARAMYVGAVLVGAVGVAASPLLASFLRLESVAPAVVFAFVSGLALIVPLYRGILQGRRRFGELTLNIGAESILRLLGSVILVLVGFQTSGVLGAFGVAMIAAFILGRTATASDMASVEPVSARRGSIKLVSLVPMLAAMGLTYGLFNLDVVLAKHYLPAAVAGDYAAISLAGRVVLYLTSSVGGVILSSYEKSSVNGGQLLAKGLAVVLGASGAVELAYAVASKPLMTLVFGPTYGGASRWLPILGAGMVLLAGANLFMYFLIAMRRMAFIAVLATALCLEVGLILWHHQGVGDIAIAFTLGSVAAFVGLATCAIRVVHQGRHA
jgi:O-antigen/teichoic acid export membrane protein